jgi:hypothetical protein
MSLRHSSVVLAACVLSSMACNNSNRAFPMYDPDTRVISRIDYDADGNSVIEARLYYRNGRPVRLEVDANEDGVVDRWESYTGENTLARVGTSSVRDGRPDTWARTDGDDVQLEMSTSRDGRIDRREFRHAQQLIRTEADTNGDGRLDQWQRFENGRLRELDLDTTLSAGQPDQRLVYTDSGTLARTERLEPTGQNGSTRNGLP